MGEGVADLAAFEEDLGGKAFDVVFTSVLNVRFALQGYLISLSAVRGTCNVHII